MCYVNLRWEDFGFYLYSVTLGWIKESFYILIDYIKSFVYEIFIFRFGIVCILSVFDR